MKKILIGFFSLLGLLLILALVLPFLVNVDKYRGQIEAQVKPEQGKLELGKLSLQILPSIRVRAESLKLSAPRELSQEINQTQPIVETKDIDFKLSLSALFTRKIAGTLVLDNPKIGFFSKGEKNSFSGFSTKENKAETKSSGESVAPGAETSSGGGLGMIAGLDVGLTIKSGELTYQDSTKAEAKTLAVIKPLDVDIASSSVKGPIKGKISMGLNTQSGGITVGGKVISEFTATLGEKITWVADIKLGELTLDGPIVKKSGSSDLVTIKGEADKDFSNITNGIDLAFLGLKGALKVNKTAQTTEVEGTFEPWAMEKIADHVKALSEYAPKGALTISDVRFSSITANPEASKYSAKIGLENVTAKSPNPAVKEIKASGDMSVNQSSAEMKLVLGVDGQEMNVRGDIANFQAPVIKGLLEAKSFDARAFQQDPSKKTKASRNFTPQEILPMIFPVAVAEQSKSVGESPLWSLGQNPMIKKSQTDVGLKFGKLTALQGVFTNVNAKLGCKSVNCSFSGSLNAYSGQISMAGQIQGEQKLAPLEVKLDIRGLKVEDALSANAPEFKDSLFGLAAGSMTLKAPLYDPQGMLATARSQGTFNLSKGRANGVKVKEWLEPVFSKVPQLSAKIPTINSDFDTLALDYELASQVMDLKSFKFRGNKGKSVDLDLKGSLNLKDQTVDLVGDLTDKNGLINVAQLKDKQGHVVIPVKLSGPMSFPKADVGYMSSALAKKTFENNKAEIKQKAQDVLQKQGKELLKKLKFR